MAVTLEEPALEGLRYITANLRQRDKDEIFATHFYGNEAEVLAATTLHCGALQTMICLDGEPVASVGAVATWPGVWNVWAYGTDKWPRVVLSATRYVRCFLIPALYNAGAVRVQCFALAAHDDARQWLERSLFARHEHNLPNWGREGQTFILYSWTRDQVEQHVRAHSSPSS